MHQHDHLDRLNALVGPAAVMDLDQRDLLPDLTGEAQPITDGAADRIAGALLGAAIGNALGRPTRHRTPAQVARRFGSVTGYVRSPRSRTPLGAVGAEGAVFLRWVGALADRSEKAAPALSRELASSRLRLDRPGQAIAVTIDRLHNGAPWYAAAPDSYGNGALLRAVADGARWLDDPQWRPLSAALGTAVTHAHPQAVAASVVLAELVAAGIAQPDLLADPVGLAHRLAEQVEDDELADRLRQLPRSRGDRPTAVDSLTRAIALVARIGDPREAVLAAVNAGGGSDIVASVVAALAGARFGLGVFPARWVDGLHRPDRVIRPTRRLIEAQGLTIDPALDRRLRGQRLGPRRRTEVTRPEVARPDVERQADGPVHIWYLIDRSGSMGPLREAVVEGVNNFVADQQKVPGPARFTLVQFDGEDPFDVLIDGKRLEAVTPLPYDRYQPRGMTPLYDAIGSLIDAAEQRMADRRRKGKADEDQLVVIFTDGLENASAHWDRTEIFARIEEKKAEGWTFAYFGADQDSYAAAAQVGIAQGSSGDWEKSSEGHLSAVAGVSESTLTWRSKSRLERRVDADAFNG